MGFYARPSIDREAAVLVGQHLFVVTALQRAAAHEGVAGPKWWMKATVPMCRAALSTLKPPGLQALCNNAQENTQSFGGWQHPGAPADARKT